MAKNWNQYQKLGWGTLCYIYFVVTTLPMMVMMSRTCIGRIRSSCSRGCRGWRTRCSRARPGGWRSRCSRALPGGPDGHCVTGRGPGVYPGVSPRVYSWVQHPGVHPRVPPGVRVPKGPHIEIIAMRTIKLLVQHCCNIRVFRHFDFKLQVHPRKWLVYDRNHYFGFGLIPKPKPK